MKLLLTGVVLVGWTLLMFAGVANTRWVVGLRRNRSENDVQRHFTQLMVGKGIGLTLAAIIILMVIWR